VPPGLIRASPIILAVVAGTALLIAHPPVGWWWATFIGPGALVLALQLAPRWSGRLGAVTGAVAFGPMLTWLILPAGYLAWGLLVAIQAAFIAALAAAVRPWLASRWLPVVVAVVWTGVDAWRAIFPLGGFEWGAIAYAHADGSFVLPVARVLGARGITLLVVLASVGAAEALRRGFLAVRDRGDAPVDRALTATNVPIALAVGALLATVLITVEPPAETGSLDVLAVQGNATGPEDPRPADPRETITTAMRDLTVEALAEEPGADLVVWPESSVDADPASDRGAALGPLVDEAAAAVGPEGTLLAGVNLDGPDPASQFINAVVAFDEEGGETDRYVKRAPVPFGEYVPFRRYLDWFPPLRQIPRDAVRGEDGQVVEVDGTDVAVGICFETLFGGLLRESILAGDEPAGLLVLVTNNASFGRSGQPAQHVAQSRLRAVETGRWVVHGALSGSTAFVSPEGEVTAETGLFELATARQVLPTVEGRTPFLVVGDVLGIGGRLLAVLALSWVVAARRRRHRGDTPSEEPHRAAAARDPATR
jgi:apolipoprotein N-acyltransferase